MKKPILTDSQVGVAVSWYINHRKHIDILILNSELRYAPSLNEDKNNPNLWKAEHWSWFLKYIN